MDNCFVRRNWLEFINDLNKYKILTNPKLFIKLNSLINEFNDNNNLGLKIIRLHKNKYSDRYNPIGFTVANKYYDSNLPLISNNFPTHNINTMLLLDDNNNYVYFWNVRNYEDYLRLINSLNSINQKELTNKLRNIIELILKAQGKNMIGLYKDVRD